MQARNIVGLYVDPAQFGVIKKSLAQALDRTLHPGRDERCNRCPG